MVERGIIKVYFGSYSHSKKLYGFIRVIGEDGEPTGEEVFFHFNQARRPEIVSGPTAEGEVAFSDVRADITFFDAEPRKGDVVVFTTESAAPKRRAVAWIPEYIWEELEGELAASAELADRFDFDYAECPGDCGQTFLNCSCAELDSFRAHNPADGYWTA